MAAGGRGAILAAMVVGPLVFGGFDDVLLVVVGVAVLAGVLGAYRAL